MEQAAKLKPLRCAIANQDMSFTAFLLAAVVLAISPGPGIAYVVARTVAGGRAEGLASCAGTAIGGMVHVIAAAAGLSVVVAQSAFAFTTIKFLGAAYLIFLGVRMLLKSGSASAVAPAPLRGIRSAIREGAIVEALNVKTALFFLAFLPQFVDVGQPVARQVLMLGVICIGLNTAADVVAVLAANRILATGIVRSARARLLERCSAVTMIGLGVLLAAARRQP